MIRINEMLRDFDKDKNIITCTCTFFNNVKDHITTYTFT